MNQKLKEALTDPKDYPEIKMTVGRNTYGRPRVQAYQSFKECEVKIGAFCSIAAGVTFLCGGDHFYERFTTYPINLLCDEGLPWHERSKGSITIGNDVWIGYGATILSGLSIGDGAVIGAMSVVTKNVAPCSIVAGNPAKKIRDRFTQTVREKYLESKWWNKPDEEIIEAAKTFFLNKHNPALSVITP
jgi:acetyltransferase-like isoleucine patch superfamily enzyme